jgi:hypothetical protein
LTKNKRVIAPKETGGLLDETKEMDGKREGRDGVGGDKGSSPRGAVQSAWDMSVAVL